MTDRTQAYVILFGVVPMILFFCASMSYVADTYSADEIVQGLRDIPAYPAPTHPFYPGYMPFGL